MIFVKCTLAGLLSVVAAATLTVVVVAVRVSIASRSSQTEAVAWDPISLTRPWAWLAAILLIFLVGFLGEFWRLSSK